MRHALLALAFLILTTSALAQPTVTATLITSQEGNILQIQSTPALAISSEESNNPPHIPYTSATIDASNESNNLPYIEYTIAASTTTQKPTPPTITNFGYSYNPDTNQLNVHFELNDPNSTSITVALMSIHDGTATTLLPETTYNASYVEFNQTFTVSNEPDAVILTYVTSDYPGAYPNIATLTLPTFVLNSNIITAVSEEDATLFITVSNGYTITPVQTRHGEKVYVISRSPGVAVVVAYRTA